MAASRIRYDMSPAQNWPIRFSRSVDDSLADLTPHIAHLRQFVDHVHFHVIPKPSDTSEEGLVVGWPHTTPTKEELAIVHAELNAKL